MRFILSIIKKIQEIQDIRTQSFVKKFLKKNYIDKKNLLIFDIGSHFGQYAFFFQNNLNVPTIYVFEPILENCEIIKKLNLNNLKVINKAVSNVNKKINFYKSNDTLFGTAEVKNTNSLYGKVKSLVLGNDNLSKIHQKNFEVEAIRIDSFIQENNLECPDIVKIDVEGHEEKVLAGIGQHLTNKKMKIIIIEIRNDNQYEGYDKLKIKRMLGQAGYKLIKRCKFPLLPGNYVYARF